ncbi:MAG: nucleotidyltransferase domain-containing protein [Anaerolineae bacterium]
MTTELDRQRQVYVAALERSLDDVVAQLAAMPEVEQVILFGSYATGRRDLFTDLDLLVVMRSSLDFVSRTADLYRRLCTDVDMDLVVYTPEEIARAGTHPFLRCALIEGRILYEKGSTG